MKKIIIGSVIAVCCLAVLLLLIPIEKKREYYEKWGKLATAAETDERAEYIIEHYDEYPSDLIDKYMRADADKADKTLDFVYNYAFNKDNYSTMSFTEDEVNCESVPKLYMYDTRWCYEKFEGGYIKTDGCVAVSLTMANLYLNHNADLDPVKIARKAEEVDNIGYWGGISNEKMVQLCESIGFDAVEHNYSPKAEEKEEPDIQTIINALNENHVVMLGMVGETFGGHALIVTSCSEDGTMRFNDPASEENTDKTWNYSDVEPEMYFLWDISAK